MARGRTSPHGLPPGIQKDKHGVMWATLEGEDARLWKARYPERPRPPRRKVKDVRDGQRVQRELQAALKAGADPQAANPTIGAYLAEWLDSRMAISDVSRRRYQQSINGQIAPLRIARLRLQELQRKHIIDWVRELLKLPHQRYPKRTIDKHTVRAAFSVMRAALNDAKETGLIPRNPCEGVEIPDPDDEEINPLTVAQVETLLGLVDTYDQGKPHRQAALYHLAIRTGLRQGEILGLRWQDVDLERSELAIVGQLQQGSRKKGKTRRAHRKLPLSPELVVILKDHRRNQLEERRLIGEGWNAAELVFCSQEGTPLSASNLWRQYTALQRRCGLATPCATCQKTGKVRGKRCADCLGHKSVALFRFHDLRHTYATLAIAAGIDIFKVSRRMGHEKIATTADKYGHLLKGQADDATKIEEFLKGGARNAS